MDTTSWEPPNEYAGFYHRVGRIDGTAELVARLLTRRYGPLTEEVQARIAETQIWELELIAERLLAAPTLKEALDGLTGLAWLNRHRRRADLLQHWAAGCPSSLASPHDSQSSDHFRANAGVMPCAITGETLYRPRMPSHPHEWLVELFRNRPLLAPELLRDALHVELPRFTEARIDSADLTDVQPTEYRADLVVLLLDEVPVLGIVVEAQLSRDKDKQFVWPVYVTTLRARFKCPVCLLVVTTDEAIARWAAKPIELGGGNRFAPLVLHPSGVPEVTDEAQAQSDPELAVLSAMAHGNDADIEKAVQIALAATSAVRGLDPRRSNMYFDLVRNSLSEAAQRALQAMDPRKYEYQSDFARRYVAEGRAALVLKQLALRYGPLAQQVETRIAEATIEELDQIGERLLTAQSLDEALG